MFRRTADDGMGCGKENDELLGVVDAMVLESKVENLGENRWRTWRTWWRRMGDLGEDLGAMAAGVPYFHLLLPSSIDCRNE